MENEQEVVKIIDNFILNSKMKMLNQMELGLREIIKLKWWQRWQAKVIAEKTLRIGQFWDKE